MKRMKRWLAMSLAVLIAVSTLAGDYLIATAAELPASDEVVADVLTDVEKDVEKDVEDAAEDDNPYKVEVYQQPTEAPVEATEEPAVEATDAPVADVTPSAEEAATPEAIADATPEAVATAVPETEATVTPSAEASATPEAVADATPETSVEATASPEASATPEVSATPEASATPEVEEVEEALEFNQSVESAGMKISLYAKPGVLPNDAQLQVEKVTSSMENKIQEAIDEETAESVEETISFDINIYSESNGGYVQPEDGTVSVTFELLNVDTEDKAVSVYHVEENGKDVQNVEQVANAGVSAEEVAFEAEHFSVYTVVLTNNGRSTEVEVSCYVVDANGTHTSIGTDSRINLGQSAVSVEDIDENLSVDGYTFAGAYINCGESNQQQITAIRYNETWDYWSWQYRYNLQYQVNNTWYDWSSNEVCFHYSEDGEAVEATVKVAVYVMDNGWVGNQEKEDQIGLHLKDGNGFYPVGVINIPKRFMTGSSPYLNNVATWNELKPYLVSMDTSKEAFSSTGGFKEANGDNNMVSYLDNVDTSKFGNIGSGNTALFNWSGSSYGFDGNIGYHLDLRLEVHTVNFINGNNNIEGLENGKTLFGSRGYFANEQIQNPNYSVYDFYVSVPEGYAIEGYYKDANFSEEYTFGQSITGDVTVYVKLIKETYTVTWKDGATTLDTDTEVAYGTNTLGLAPAVEDKEEGGYTYTFQGWSVEDDGTVDKIPTAVTENVTYYAVFDQEPVSYTITYDLDGGSLNGASNPTEYTVDTETFTLNNPTKAGYTFLGWTGTDLSGETMTVTVEKGSTGDREYTAHWKQNTITISGTKTWDDDDNLEGIRPDSITIVLKGDGEEVSRTTVSEGADGSWTYTFENLPTHENGNEINYTIEEDPTPEYYTASVNGYDVTNTYDPIEVTVTITENSGRMVYDGEEKTVTGYTVSSDYATYTEADFTFSGDATVKGTNVGSYNMELKAEDFTNNNKNYRVTFVIVDGILAITPITDEVVVTITGNTDEQVYDGQAHSVSDYTVSIDNDKYKESDFDFSGTATATGTVVGEYPMGLAAGQFTNNNANFANVTFVVNDGKLTINPAQVTVTITGNLDVKTYNGSEQQVEGYKVEISNPLYTEDDFAFSGVAVAKGTDVNTYPMGLAEEQFTNNNKNFDVNFVVTDGSLTIEKLPVTVTITGEIDSKAYSGSEQSVEGYEVETSDKLYTEADFTFAGKAIAKGTAVGTYPMGLAEEQFTNNNDNFNVSFVVIDGKLEITQNEVVVTITGNKDSKVYNGAEQQVKGYSVEISDELYKETDFAFSGTDVAKGTAVGTYPMGLADTQFTNNNDNFKVTFKVTDGELEITKAQVTVTITGNKDSLVYNGSEQQVEGYNVEISNSLYAEEDFTFSGEAVAKGTDVDTYPMGLTVDQFVNTNDNFTVTFNVTDGELEITPLAVEVEIVGNTDSKVYNGAKQSVEDYEVTTSDALYTEADFTFSGNAVAEGTDVATYPMGLDETQFTNNNDNFTVTFKVTDGELTITKKPVTMTSDTSEKIYDGKALTSKVVIAEGFVDGEGATYNVTGSQTEVGTSNNDFTYTLKEGTKAGNYEITTVVGTLTVKPLDAVEVTIVGNKFETIYDGGEHKAEGYTVTINDGNTSTYSEKDFAFSGSDVVAKTDAGTYAMGLDASQFKNTNPNFTNVVFKVTDGELTINKRTVALKSADANKVYDGEALTNDSVTVTAGSFADGEGATYDVTGSQTEVGTSNNDFTYTLKEGTKAENYTIIKEEGNLTVTPFEEKITVTITEHGGEYTYDGEEKTVTGYDVAISNDVYTTDDFTFSGNDSVSGTDAGSYDMELTADDFANTNTNFTNVEFVIEDARLVIKPIDKVTVTITEKSGTATYDGTEKKVEGYDVSIDNSLYIEADFTFSGEAVAKGTNAGTYDMDVKATDFTNTNKNFTTVEFVIVDGQLVITASENEVVVMIQENSDAKVYTGQEQSVTGYTVTSISNSLYTEADFEFTGDATAKGTEVGTYDMNLTAADFVNNSTDFTNVTFVITDGQLTITPVTDEVTVTIAENSDTKVYTGQEQSVTGYTVASISNPLYTESDFTFGGEAVAKGTNVGTYDMEVKADDFTNISKNFTNVTFVVEDGQLEITPVAEAVTVTITENSDSFVYDGNEKSVNGYEVTSISNALYTEADFTFTGNDVVTGTNVGTYHMEVTADDFTNTNKNFANVKFVVVDGQLAITPVTTEVVVTVTENSATYTYDGTEKTVTGYEVTSISNSLYTEADFAFGGKAEVKGINAGSYDMAVNAADFTNISKNFTNVRFVVVDGQLQINPIAEVTVRITENSGAYTYDGTEKTVTGYEVTSISNSLYTEADFTFSGEATVAGIDAGTYDMEVKAEDFTNINNNFAKVTFEVVDGQLVISPVDEVVVIITENSATYTYDATEKSVAGYEVTDISNELYKDTNFSFNGTDVVKGTKVGTYDMLLTAEDFVNNNNNFAKVTFQIVDGKLTITPISEEVVVTITENSGRYTYDGTEKTVEGYEVTDISNELYTEADFTFSGEAVAKGTDVGTYDMEVKAEDFENVNTEIFENVTFVVEDGELIIDPYAEEVKVQIVGKNDTVLYDGQTHSVKGYDITIGSESAPEIVQMVRLNSSVSADGFLKEEDIKLVGSDEVVQTNAGTYAQGLEASDFSVENDNFSNVVLEITDGELVINKRQVTLTSANGSKVYDGTALTKKKVRVSGDGFAEGEGATYKVTGKQTQVGESKNKFSYTLNANTLADNYEISTVFGKLTVTPVEVTPTPEDPTPSNPTPTPTPTTDNIITIEDEPVPMADAPVPDDDGPAVLGARRSNDPGAAVLGARRGTEYAVLGKRRRPETGDSMELLLWYIALGMSVGAAIMAATKVRKNKVD